MFCFILGNKKVQYVTHSVVKKLIKAKQSHSYNILKGPGNSLCTESRFWILHCGLEIVFQAAGSYRVDFNLAQQ